MKVIDDSTVVVSSSSELKNVLESDNGYLYVYFDNDIVLESGIKIFSGKTNVTIDGTYNGIRHTFTDKKTLASGDTISISSPLVLKVVVCNLDIIGYNYYGTIYVPESTSYKNTIVEYNNIIYNGPQISFNPSGLTRFIDSNITISDGSLVTGNEVAECNRIEIGGITNIVHNSKSNSAFWFRNSDPSLTILTNSKVNFTSLYRELFYGPNNLVFSILSNSYFSVTSHSGLAYGNFGTSSTTISSNSEFVLKQTSANGSYSSWYSYGSITLNDNASLTIINDYSGISASNYNINFSNNGGLILNNPKRFVLYNEKASVINASSSIPFDFKFSRLNLFNSSIKMDEDITLQTLPTYSWYKENSSASISGNFNSSTCKIVSHNFSSDELNKLPDLSNFIFANKKIFSIGDFAFRVNSLTDTDKKMSGVTGTGNSVLISYNDVNVVVVSDSDGNFNYSYDNELAIGTVITFNVKMKDDVIYHTKVIQIVYSGELILDSASKIVNFSLKPISLNPILCPRLDELKIKVIDSRVNSTPWRLYATINHELETISSEVLEGSLVYKDSNGIVPLSLNPVLVYSGEANDGNTKTTEITFNDDEGILLLINGKIINGKEYSSNIIWSIEE